MAGNRSTDLLLAKARNAQLEDSVDEFHGQDVKPNETVKIARSGYGRLPVYKLTPSGCVRILVAVQSIHEVLSAPGYSAVCFDCGNDDCCAGATDTLNDCPGREPRKFRICPVTSCRKKVYDPSPTGKFMQDEFDHSAREKSDPNAIEDETYASSTPESRTKAAMNDHLIGFHPSEAATMGVGARRELPKLTVV